jgi:hypothetical protein
VTVPFPTSPVTLTGQYVALEAFDPLLNKGKLVVQFGDGTQPFPLVAGPTGPTGAASTAPGPQGVPGVQGPPGLNGPLVIDGGAAVVSASEILDGGSATG